MYLEVHYTTNNDIDFILYTSAGQVGSSYVSGGPLVEAGCRVSGVPIIRIIVFWCLYWDHLSATVSPTKLKIEPGMPGCEKLGHPLQ